MQRWTVNGPSDVERTTRPPLLSERTTQEPATAKRVSRRDGWRGASECASYGGEAKVYPALTASFAFFVSLIGQVGLL